MLNSRRLLLAALLVALVPWSAFAQTAKAPAAAPAPATALQLRPVQANIDFDTPEGGGAEKCTVAEIKSAGLAGWEVLDGDGNVLRRFLDTNKDSKVDQWCYFKDGVEVYRDIDADFNKKADQYRWLSTAGTRWGLDTNEDGRIDSWKVISPEEVSEEVVLALATNDAERFQRLLLTAPELKGLQLGEAQAKELTKKLEATATGIGELLKTQKFVTPTTRWVNFGATRPGVVPAGTEGQLQDLLVYENTAAVVEADGTHNQVIIGTLVKVGDVWRLISLPQSMSDGDATAVAGGFFFEGPLARRAATEVPVAGGLDPELQKLLGQLEEIDQKLQNTSDLPAVADLNAQKTDVFEKLAGKTQGEERDTWLHQLADSASAAAQAGNFPKGIERLKDLCTRLEKENASTDLIAYIKFRYLQADFSLQLLTPNGPIEEIQKKWLADLEQFVTDYPKSKDAADAMLQLAMAQEFAGQDAKAVEWYSRIMTELADSPAAVKAAGAKRRIESVGQPLVLEANDTQGNPVSAKALQGKVVLVHYWATWYNPCLMDLFVLKGMLTKYGPENVAIVGINVDMTREAMDNYLKNNPLPWPQLYDAGGLDGPLASSYGVLTLPTMLLADKTGKVVSRNLQAGDVDAQLRNLLR